MDNGVKLITFMLQEDEYGFEIDFVQEIRRMKRFTHVPQAPVFVEGIIKLRGKVIPLIDLRKRLGLPDKEYGKYTRNIILNMEGHILGVIVDSVTEMLTIPEENIDPPDSVLATTGFLKGVAKVPGRMVLIVNMDTAFTPEEKGLLAVVPKKVKVVPPKPAEEKERLKKGPQKKGQGRKSR
jgi:purine-binding chemotaxis protein CheW